jgi:hypothetical protein
VAGAALLALLVVLDNVVLREACARLKEDVCQLECDAKEIGFVDPVSNVRWVAVAFPRMTLTAVTDEVVVQVLNAWQAVAVPPRMRRIVAMATRAGQALNAR